MKTIKLTEPEYGHLIGMLEKVCRSDARMNGLICVAAEPIEVERVKAITAKAILQAENGGM